MRLVWDRAPGMATERASRKVVDAEHHYGITEFSNIKLPIPLPVKSK
jgi:hypothetical protein